MDKIKSIKGSDINIHMDFFNHIPTNQEMEEKAPIDTEILRKIKATHMSENASAIAIVQSYVDKNCVKCGRHRVELVTLENGHQYHICEKCRYIEEQKRCCEDKDCSYDFGKINLHGKLVTYLKEVNNE